MEKSKSHISIKSYSNAIPSLANLAKIDSISFGINGIIDREKIHTYILSSCEMFRFKLKPDRFNSKVYHAYVGASVNKVSKIMIVSIRMYRGSVSLYDNIDVVIENAADMTMKQLVHAAYKLFNSHIQKTRHISDKV